MSKTKRKRYSGAFKAKVGMEALMGIKTVGQIARENQVHPVQVTQWKGVIRDRLPELFEAPAPEGPESQELIKQLHEKIGQLTVEADWLKKNARLWDCERAPPMDRSRTKIECGSPMRIAGCFTQRFLLRTGAGERREPGRDEADGRVVYELAVVRQSAVDGLVATRRGGDQPQAGSAVDGGNGAGSGVSETVVEPTWGWAPDLSVPTGRPCHHGSGPGLVQRHHASSCEGRNRARSCGW